MHGGVVGDGDVDALALMLGLAEEIDTAITEAVKGLRDCGYSWPRSAPGSASPARLPSSDGGVADPRGSCKPICKPDAARQDETETPKAANGDVIYPVRRGHRTRERLPETPETYVVLLITQRGQGESRRRRSVNAELLAPQRNECRENIQRLGKGWRRGSYLGLDGRDQAPAHLLAELQVHVPVPL